MGRLTLSLMLLAILFGCQADAAFPYRYYAIRANSYAGTLIGATQSNDLPFTICAPSPGKIEPCLLMLKDQYLQLKADYEEKSTRLQCFESGRTGC